MSTLILPKSNGKQSKKEHENDSKGPTLPKIITEIRELSQELFLHPAEKPLFNAPVFRG